jgi:glycosyltransferase involved in cell wall biosynthesis
MVSLVVPIYRSETNLPDLLRGLTRLAEQIEFEAVFVVDGSPDRCAEILEAALADQPFSSQLIQLSRNFGAFSAIAAGFEHGRGDIFAAVAADLQAPLDLVVEFASRLSSGKVDVVVGERTGREDSWLTRSVSNFYWGLFRRVAMREIPSGGVDTFACTAQVRDALLRLPEVDSSLISLLFWLGFRRESVPFVRRKRIAGRSAWSLRKKIDYALYSIFSFTDLPVRLLLIVGASASVLAFVTGVVVLAYRLLGRIHVPGYTVLALLIVFYGGITTFALGLIGQYLWLTLQNARKRPSYVVRAVRLYEAAICDAEPRQTSEPQP